MSIQLTTLLVGFVSDHTLRSMWTPVTATDAPGWWFITWFIIRCCRYCCLASFSWIVPYLISDVSLHLLYRSRMFRGAYSTLHLHTSLNQDAVKCPWSCLSQSPDGSLACVDVLMAINWCCCSLIRKQSPMLELKGDLQTCVIHWDHTGLSEQLPYSCD